MQEAVLNTMAKRRDVAIKTILRAKEMEADQYLPPGVSQSLRKVVLDEINDFYSLAVELLKTASTDNVQINEFWLDRLEEKISSIVHAAVNGS